MTSYSVRIWYSDSNGEPVRTRCNPVTLPLLVFALVQGLKAGSVLKFSICRHR